MSRSSNATHRMERQGSNDGYGSVLIDIGHSIDW
jgi:hypothetical protein